MKRTAPKSGDIPDIRICALEAEFKEQWLVLWKSYLDFYGTTLPEHVSRHTWDDILGNDRLIGLAAQIKGRLVGFAIVVLHEATWSMSHVAYLEDLFVDAKMRRRGVARSLIEAAIGMAKQRSCETIYWHTLSNNHAARKLYDQFVCADEFVRYRIKI